MLLKWQMHTAPGHFHITWYKAHIISFPFCCEVCPLPNKLLQVPEEQLPLPTVIRLPPLNFCSLRDLITHWQDQVISYLFMYMSCLFIHIGKILESKGHILFIFAFPVALCLVFGAWLIVHKSADRLNTWFIHFWNHRGRQELDSTTTLQRKG